MARNQLQTQKEIVTTRGLYKDGIVVAEQPFSPKGIADVLIVFLESPKTFNTSRGNAAAVWKALNRTKGKWKDGSGVPYVRTLRKEAEKRRPKLKW